MRFDIAFQALVTSGIIIKGEAFVSPNPKVSNFRSIAQLNARGPYGDEGDWDNDDFLDSLSKGPSPAQENEIDDGPGQAGLKTEHDHNGEGGTRFKQMMEAAKNAQANRGSTRPQQPDGTTAPFEYTPPPQFTQASQQAPPPQMPAGMPEDQAALFQQFMAFQQMMQQQQGGQAPVQSMAPPPPQQQGGVDAKGRKIGRNKDADAITNTADLYFAQLKRDSTVRTMARYSGDEETANNVMGDESVKELNDMIIVNPYLKAEQEADEDMAYENFMEMYGDDIKEKEVKIKTDKGKDYTGVNYRDKLKAAKERKNKKSQTPSSDSSVSTTTPEPVAASPPPAVVSSTTEVAPTPPQTTTVESVASSQPNVSEKSGESAVWVSDKPIAPVPAPSTEDKEETRRDIRTLMGLVLKHRGGPGFGKGRLKPAEAERFETLYNKVSSLLREEAGMGAASKEKTAPPTPAVNEAVPVTATPPTAAAATAPVPSDRLSGTLACIEGALEMYKNSPGESQEDNLRALQAALNAAVNTISENGATAQDKPPQQPAATTMGFPDSYQVTKPEEVATSAMPFPNTYEVTKPDESTAGSSESAASGDSTDVDANAESLKRIYDKLVAASGDGKFGLKGEMSLQEADTLADDIVEMRNILMSELNSM